MSKISTKGVPTELGTEKISKLLMLYAIPAIIAQTASSLYHMIDSIFIGQGVGALAISGLATTFPFMNLSAAFGAMIGGGGATLISVKLGQRDYDSACTILGNLVTHNVIVGLTFGGVSLLFLDDILFFFGASAATLPYARDFMEIVLYGNLITHLYLGINAALRASGHPKESMYATIITVVCNLLLAPLFIYALGWGIRGAALATMLSQVVTLAWQTRLLSNPNELMHQRKGIYALRARFVKGILGIGLSPFLINAAACIVVIIINKGLRMYGDNGDMAIASYGIANRVIFIFVMVVLGVTQGMQPIVGYNFGARRYDRVKETLKQTMMWAAAVTFVGFALCEGIPELISRAFTTDATRIANASKGMRISAMFLVLAGVQMVATNFFQSIGRVNKSIFLSLTRQVLFLIPLLLILPQYIGENGVWLSIPIADLISGILAIILLRGQFKEWNTPTFVK